MHCRRATGKISASIVLISLGVITAALVYQWNAVVAPSDILMHQVVVESVALSEPVSVTNARWEITLVIRNDGKEKVFMKNLYVNKILVDEYGLAPRDSLSSKSVIGTSLPADGVVIGSNERFTISVWIGGDLFDIGNQISLHIFNPYKMEYTRYITLK
jgi:hypothetical protein